MIFYAVIDTNILISALISKNPNSATVKVIKAVMDGKIAPLIHKNILAEYKDVLYREKFHLQPSTVQTVLRAFEIYGLEVEPKSSNENFLDPDDLIFYEVTLAKQNEMAYLITGNLRHYPVCNFVVTATQMISIIKNYEI
ncbi:putative toxin-antitoxin system toxin component, PIN family [bacterium]|nr:putative toxin-antitoxin system toxin component, PIN family [bacterium]